MKNNIKVGDYVRTKHLGGSIEKIIKIMPKEKTPDLKTKYTTDVSALYSSKITEDEIIKSSPNIIDLIEVGDYVNGLYVHGITDYGLEVYMFGDTKEYLKEDEIKSIVTKEQMEDMEYKIEK